MTPSPHSIEIEQELLSACLLDPETLSSTADMVDWRDFYKSAHQNIFRCAVYIVRKGDPLDMSILYQMLKEKKMSEGPATEIAQILDAPASLSPSRAAKKVRELAQARRLAIQCQKTISKISECHGEYQGILDEHQHNVLDIDFGGSDAFISIRELMQRTVERYESKNDPGTHISVRTGFHDIDRMTGGFRSSKLIVISARPRIGKTAMMLSMCRNIARFGVGVGIFSIEMDADELMDRFLSMETGIATPILHGDRPLSQSQWLQITKSAEDLNKWPVWIDDAGGLQIQELRRRSRKLKKLGARIIFVDQLSKIVGGKGGSEYEKTTDIVHQIDSLKKELRLPIVLLAQINRKGEEKGRPTLTDLKSTGAIEEDADIVLIGHRKYPYSKRPEDERHCQWEIAKHRGGPEWIIDTITWIPEKTLFCDKDIS